MHEKVLRNAKIYFININAFFDNSVEKMNVTINGDFRKNLLEAKCNNLICTQRTK